MEKPPLLFFVEGDKTFADIYIPRLEEDGWKVVWIISFSEAERRLKRSTPSVFLIDVKDGEENEALIFFSQVKLEPSFSLIPVIIFAHAPNRSWMQTILKQGIHACFLKSHTRPATLLKTLSQLGFENRK